MGEAESIVDLSGRQRHPNEDRYVEDRAKRDPLRIDGGRPIGHEPIPGSAQAEWRIAHDEIPELPVDLLVDIHDAAIAQARGALRIELTPKGGGHPRNLAAIRGQERFDSLLRTASVGLLVRQRK